MGEGYRRSGIRFTRRRIMAGGATIGIGAASMIAVGCGDDDDDDQSTATATATANATSPSEPTATSSGGQPSGGNDPDVAAVRQAVDEGISPGGTMAVVWENEPAGTTDPHKVSAGGTRPMLAAPYEGFIYAPGGGQDNVGYLTPSWETPDPATFIFNIREGVKFHDGSDFDAEIAKWNLERIRSEGFYYEAGWSGAAAGLSNIEVMDAHTLRVDFDVEKVDSIGTFYYVGIYWPTAMVSRQAVESGADIDLKPVGTGPFQLKNWQTGVSMTFERFPEYWGHDANGNQLPYLDELEFRGIAESSVAVIALQENEVQSVMVTPQDAVLLENDKNIELNRRNVPQIIIWMNKKRPPFNDVRLRKALAHAIRRDELVAAAWFNQASPYAGGYSEDGDWYDPNFKGQVYDTSITAQALQEAGMADGFSFELTVGASGPNRTMGELLQSQLAEVGIKVSLATKDEAESVQDMLRTPNSPMEAFIGNAGTPGLGEVPTTTAVHLLDTFQSNAPQDETTVGRDLYKQIQSEFDKEARYKLFQQFAQWFWLEHYGTVPLVWGVRIGAQRVKYGGFDYMTTAPQAWWNFAYQRS